MLNTGSEVYDTYLKLQITNIRTHTVVLEKTLGESLGLQGDPTSPSSRKSVLNIHQKDRCWSWSSKTLATWCEELSRWKRLWCWERLEGRRRRGWQRMRWLDGITNSMDVSLSRLRDGEGQGGLACCSPWDRTESDITEQLNNNNKFLK